MQNIRYIIAILIFIAIAITGVLIFSEQEDNSYIEMIPYNNTSVVGEIGFVTEIYCPINNHTDNLIYLDHLTEIKDPKNDPKSDKKRLNVILLYKCTKHNKVFTIQ